jgi:hypothetical protein
MADRTVHELTQISSGVITSTDEVAIWDTSEGVSKKILLSDLWSVIRPRTAILKNIKASTVNGGTATSGAWYIIPILKCEDPDNIISNYTGASFEIGAGTYRIEVSSPFYDCNLAQTRLYNVTDYGVQKNINSYDMLGQTVRCNTSGNVNTSSWLTGTFTISGYKTLRVEYRVSTTRTDTGLGVACTWGYGIFAIVQITKL